MPIVFTADYTPGYFGLGPFPHTVSDVNRVQMREQASQKNMRKSGDDENIMIRSVRSVDLNLK